MKLEIGNIVRLASGGPKMTVDQNPANDLVRCIWFSGDRLCDGNFSAKTLEMVRPDVTVIYPRQPHPNHDDDCDFFPSYDDL